jgi:hypothetical protein
MILGGFQEGAVSSGTPKLDCALDRRTGGKRFAR